MLTHAAPLGLDADPEAVKARALAILAGEARLERPLEAFTPWDNIPWEAQAEQLLRCRMGDGFIGLRPPPRIDQEVRGLVARLGLAPGAPVLDLGCGPGLHGNRLGALGVAVTGIDIAEPVVRHAQRVADAARLPCRYRPLSFFAMEFREEFAGAFLANSTFNHLDQPQRAALLCRVQRALRPGGAFACEVYLAPSVEVGPDAPPSERRRLYALPYSPWSARPHHWLERILDFPAQQQRVTHHVILHEDGTIGDHWSRTRLLERAALEAELEAAGLSGCEWFDHALRPLPSPSLDALGEHAWVVARRQGGTAP
ncbi:MAG: class I SAM-dependent methyltransferase [Myxococcales bacterium]|nr:class I SAM-dependent methyltransferase [Myxococcales bacterium]